ncbi:dihydrolipoyl dehydrogenase [Nocardioides sp.]|uniref:dihydrolipoyl dehydrogenase n=1 Tax=Nocardioides sp. TaxID=35761 RepID=UPI003516C15D
MTDVDVLVLGAGSGGYATALRAAQLGLRVTLVERDRLGGTCLHQGCIPTKALLHAAEVADHVRDAAHVGVRASLEGIDMPAVNAYRDQVVSRLFKGLTGLVGSRGITVVAGEGRVTGPREVTVTDAAGVATVHTGRHLVLATGSMPRTLPAVPIDGRRVVTSEEALRLDRVPASVVVLGGGVIGCEFASIWRSLGAEVTLVEALPRLVAGEDEAASAALQRGFRKRGITVRTGSPVTGVKVEEGTAGPVTVALEGGDTLRADLLLVAVGRVARVDDLGFEAIGVRVERGLVVTDERCRTGVDGVYAVGDLTAGPQLAHRGFAQGMFVAEDIAGLSPAPVDPAAVPRVTYSRPEVASVGLTETEAVQAHGADAVRSLTYDLAGNGKAQILGTQGFVKLVRRVDGPLLGVHLVGDRVGDLVGEAQLMVGWEAHPEDVAPLVHAHPTLDEALGEACLALAGSPLHTHG